MIDLELQAELKLGLQVAIRKWLDKTCEDDNAPADVWIPDTLVARMRDAAFVVYQLNAESQEFVRNETGD